MPLSNHDTQIHYGIPQDMNTDHLPVLGPNHKAEVVLSILYGNADVALQLEDMFQKQVNQDINNMYQPDQTKTEWVCLGCRTKGDRINQWECATNKAAWEWPQTKRSKNWAKEKGEKWKA